jgi:formyl-CoA transferase
VSVYGQDGPYRDRPGLDRNGIAMGGLMYITGYPDRPPVRPGVIVSDYLTGVCNAFSILAAVYERDTKARATGAAPRGQWVDLTLYESILRIMEHTLATYDRLGVVREREGNRLKNSAPSTTGSRDGHLHHRGGRRTLSAALPRDGRDSAHRPLRWRSARARRQINAIVAEWVASKPSMELQAILERHEVPFGVALPVADIFADPHTSRGAIETVDDPIGPCAAGRGSALLHARPCRSGAPD